MKSIKLILKLLLFFMASFSSYANTNMFEFKNEISQVVLENYLSRSIEFAGLCSEGSTGTAPYFKDNLRMIKNIGAKFIGRAAFTWDAPVNDDMHYKIAEESADKIHKIDPEIILQACVFETTYSCKVPEAKEREISPGGVENIPIPVWVFKAFNLKPKKRCFSYEKMIFENGNFLNLWLPGASVPDISRLETRLWFYYRARRYIDAGYESIHFGQVLLTGANDHNQKHWKDLLKRLRNYAKKTSRRNYVLFDAHIVVDQGNMKFIKSGENLLWDFLGFPLRLNEDSNPLNAKLKLGYLDSIYGKAPGGIHPSGWKCDTIPQIIEVDNYQSGLALDNEFLIWGADEATWFANLKEENRNDFLRYAHKWILDNAPGAHFEMPGRRPAQVPVANPRMWSYIANTRSKSCPEGFNQEETIKEIWNDPQYKEKSKRPFNHQELAATKKNKNGLIGHWTFKNIHSNIIEDVSGLKNNAHLQRAFSLEELYAFYKVYGDFNSNAETISGKKFIEKNNPPPYSSFLTKGFKKNAYLFNGTTYVNIPSQCKKNGLTCSFVIWIKFNNLKKSFLLFNNFIWNVSGVYIKYYHKKNNLYVELFDGSGERRTNSFNNISTNRWMQLAFTADGKKLKTYIDGKLIRAVTAGPIICNQQAVLGQYCEDVCVEDLMIFDIPLTDSEIRKLYNSYLK